MKNRITLDSEQSEHQRVKEDLASRLAAGIPHNLSIGRMQELCRRAEELINDPLAELLSGEVIQVLQEVGDFGVPATKERFSTADLGKAPVIWQGYDFKWLCNKNPIESEMPAINVRVWQLTESVNLAAIFGQVLGEGPTVENWNKIAIPLRWIRAEIEKSVSNDDGEAWLVDSGYANLVPVSYMLRGEPAAVHVSRGSVGWCVGIYPVSNPALWHPGYRIFSREF